MQQFTVPQFIDVEDKILGPITGRQFIILLAAFVASGIAYKLAEFITFVFLSLFFLISAGILAFLKINGQPFHLFILNVIQTLKKPKLRIWHNQYAKTRKELIEQEAPEIKKAELIPKKPIYAKSRLAEVSLIVDTGGVYQGGDEDIEIN